MEYQIWPYICINILKSIPMQIINLCIIIPLFLYFINWLWPLTIHKQHKHLQKSHFGIIRKCPTCSFYNQTLLPAGHRRKWLTNCQYRRNSLSNFLLHGKVARYYGPVCWRWIFPMVQNNCVYISMLASNSWLSCLCLLRQILLTCATTAGLFSTSFLC